MSTSRSWLADRVGDIDDSGNVTPAAGSAIRGWGRLGRSVGTLTAGLVLAGGLALTGASGASAAPVASSAAVAAAVGTLSNTDAAQFLGLVNQRRAAAGLAPLTVAGDLASIAQGWSLAMAKVDTLSHNGAMFAQAEVPGWRTLAENVGVGYSVQSLDDAFYASEHHRENLLDPTVSQVGIGVAQLDGGKMYVTFDFRGMWTTPATAPSQPSNGQQADQAAREQAAKEKAAKQAAARKAAAEKVAKAKAAKAKAAKAKAAKAQAAKAKAAKIRAAKGKAAKVKAAKLKAAKLKAAKARAAKAKARAKAARARRHHHRSRS